MNMKRKKKVIEYKILNNKFADYNILQINYYIKYKLQNPIAAKNITQSLKNRIRILKQFPYLGKRYSKENPNIIIFIHKKYLIFYEIQEKEKLIIIKTIIHSMQNRNI